jgi:hypothetical protein
MVQPETVQFWVQSSFALHSHGAADVQPSVRFVRAGFGTSASPPPVPLPLELDDEEEDEDDDEAVEDPSSSSDLHAATSRRPTESASIARRTR